MESARLAVGFFCLALGAASLQCGGGTAIPGRDGGEGGPSPGLPAGHRATPATCMTTRPPGITNAGVDSGSFPGRCGVDADCTQGKNGRCGPTFGVRSEAGNACSYDACFTDGDCPSTAACLCAPTGNRCLGGNCKVDDDCGAGGSCSASQSDTCASFGGPVGFYCRTPSDACRNDSDCKENGRSGSCVWQAMITKWACTYGVCGG